MGGITLDELIIILTVLSIEGYGDCKVTTNLEYNVSGAGKFITNGETIIDIDCFC